MDKETTLFSTEETAKRLAITRQGLDYLVKTGKIKPVPNIKSKYKFFDQESIDRYRTQG